MSRTRRAYRMPGQTLIDGTRVHQSPTYVIRLRERDMSAAARRRFLSTADRFNDYGDE